jgi:hypothetical protein
MRCAVEHMGEERATRYLRKFHPWYVERLGDTRAEQKALQAAVQTAPTLTHVRALLGISGASPELPPELFRAA